MATIVSRIIFFCRSGSLLLGITALIIAAVADRAIPGKHQTKLSDPHQRMLVTLLAATACGALLLVPEGRLLNREDQQPPPHVKFFVVLMLLEWLLALVIVVMAFSALVVDARVPAPPVYQLAADMMALAAGVLAAVVAVGPLALLLSRQAQEAALQAQA